MWIRDEEFIRGKVPMTKFGVRTLVMGYLKIEKEDILLDIGCGTGSISVEAALQGSKVFSIDLNNEACDLTKENAENFNADVEVFRGRAPMDLPKLEFNKCFIGGSMGNLPEIFQYLEKNLDSKGTVCATFITLKNLNEFKNLLKEYNYKNIETILVQFSKEDKIGLLRGENPIFIVKGEKND